jgi:geranylgeranyl pyrophosphate synthase
VDLGSLVHLEKSPQRIVEICRTSMSLKSGSLFRLAIELGALVGGADKQQLALLRALGFKTGLCLQMFDDLGNLDLEQPTAKHLEDLVLRRPSYIWWTIAETFPDSLPEFNSGLNALPELRALREYLQRTAVRAEGVKRAQKFKEEILGQLQAQPQLNSTAQSEYKNVIERIAHAYFSSN